MRRRLFHGPEYSAHPESMLMDGWPNGLVCDNQTVMDAYDVALLDELRGGQGLAVRPPTHAGGAWGCFGGIHINGRDLKRAKTSGGTGTIEAS